MSTAISPSPPPLLSRTQAITRRRRHQPPSLPRQHPATSSIPWPLQPLPCHPLHRPSHASRGTHRPPRRRRSHCAYFFLVFILFSSFRTSAGQCRLRHCRRHLPSRTHRLPSRRHITLLGRQPPRCTRPYVPRGDTRATAAAHRTWYPPSKKNCKSFVPFTSNFPLAQTPRRLTKKTWPHKDI